MQVPVVCVWSVMTFSANVSFSAVTTVMVSTASA